MKLFLMRPSLHCNRKNFACLMQLFHAKFIVLISKKPNESKEKLPKTQLALSSHWDMLHYVSPRVFGPGAIPSSSTTTTSAFGSTSRTSTAGRCMVRSRTSDSPGCSPQTARDPALAAAPTNLGRISNYTSMSAWEAPSCRR